ncbi:MAG: leucine-rich repeat protein [Rikenellaceae bacterium]
MKHLFNKVLSVVMLTFMLFVTSCSNDPEVQLQVPEGDRTLTFSASTADITRGEEVSNANFNRFTIYAYNAADGWFIDKMVMTKGSDGTWSPDADSPSSVQLPAVGTSYFFAYGDQVSADGVQADSGVEFVKSEENSFMKYDMPSDIASQPDLLMAESVTLSSESTDLNVSFVFHYVLTAIKFSAEGSDYQIKSLSLSGFNPAVDISFSATYSTDNYSNNSSAAGSLDVEITAPEGNTGALTNSTGTILIPVQEASNITYAYTAVAYDDNDAELDKIEKSGTLPEGTLAMGKFTTYNIVTGDYQQPAEAYDFNLDNYGTDETSKGWTLDNFREAVATADAEGTTHYKITGSYGFTGDISILGSAADTFNQIQTSGVTIDMSEVVFDDDDSWASVGTGAFDFNPYEYRLSTFAFGSAKNMVKCILPTSPAIDGIMVSAFNGCTNLESIENTENIVFIETNAFLNCTSLKSLSLPNLLYVSDGAFHTCTSLTSLDLPKLYYMKNSDYVFNSCSNLTELKLTTSEDILLSLGSSYLSNTFGKFDTEKCELWLNVNKFDEITPSTEKNEAGEYELFKNATWGSVVWKEIHLVYDDGSEFDSSKIALINLDDYTSKSSGMASDIDKYDALQYNYYYVVGSWDNATLGTKSNNPFSGLQTQNVTIDMGTSTKYNTSSYYYINAYVFQQTDGVDFSSIQKIIMPSCCKYVSYWAFAGCANLKEIVATGVTNLANAANFINGCESLETLVLSSFTYKPSTSYLSSSAFNEAPTNNITITLPTNQEDDITDGNVWAGKTWKEIIIVE